MSAPAARLAESASGPNLLVRWWRNRQLARSADKRLNLALQGGGAHGAFTWGVLDGLIEDPRVTLEGISGSSAGAINAVVMAHGWMQGGRDGARKALADFWRDVGQQIPWGLMTKGEGESLRLLPATRMLAQWVSLFSPGNLNPLSINPLRTLLKNQVDFDALRKHTPFKLFVGATQANTGRLRLFREHELTLDMLLASACLPKVHPTVEIEGEPYWDGGYAANPAVFPLIYDCESSDIMVVLLAPHHHHETPHTMEDIDARIQDFGFKTHFLREMQMIARVNAMANDA
ncbi:MAG: patatin-like phospholipase family protein, partial [Rhodoferax sp.]|nr:patatin-like phospholipase family protein [Rhodoferax sp.]